ncbi:MAG: hypothetical protein NVV57_08800 [Demequina sp.]|jgi:hypothetical protein|nr:hypothetical protein [Demequina sp.]
MALRTPAKMLAALTIALALAACGGGKDDDAVTQEGTVSSVQEGGDPLVFVFSTVPQSSLNNAIITVAARDLDGAKPEEVERGDEVKVTVSVCTASIPAQCTATHVEVTK